MKRALLGFFVFWLMLVAVLTWCMYLAGIEGDLVHLMLVAAGVMAATTCAGLCMGLVVHGLLDYARDRGKRVGLSKRAMKEIRSDR